MLGRLSHPIVRHAPSITSHRLFPAIVGLWFGALFSLGSLAIRSSLLESLVIALHIDTLVPAAAPPLGMTARILLAFMLGVIGGGLGFLLAGQVAKLFGLSQPVAAVQPNSESADTPPAKSFGRNVLAVSELDSEPIVQTEAKTEFGPKTARRRGLTASDDGLPVAAENMMAELHTPPAVLDLQSFAETEEHVTSAPEHESAFQAAYQAHEDHLVIPAAHIEPEITSLGQPDLADLSPLQLIDRLAHVIAARKAKQDETSPLVLPSLALLRQPTVPPVEPEQVAPQATPAPSAAALPTALRPISLDYVVDEEHLDPRNLRPFARLERTPLVAPQENTPPKTAVHASHDEAEPEAIEPVVALPGHGPLAEAGQAFAALPSAEAQRRFDAPVEVPTPTQAISAQLPEPHDPAETERALKAALSNLQRMSGTA